MKEGAKERKEEEQAGQRAGGQEGSLSNKGWWVVDESLSDPRTSTTHAPYSHPDITLTAKSKHRKGEGL